MMMKDEDEGASSSSLSSSMMISKSRGLEHFQQHTAEHYTRIAMNGATEVCSSRKRRRRSLPLACAKCSCHYTAIDCVRGNALFICTLMCSIRYCMALMSIPCSSTRSVTFSSSKITKQFGGWNVLHHQLLSRAERISSSSGTNLLSSVTAISSKILQDDDGNRDFNEDEYPNPDAKGNVDDDEIDADEYFGRFISEALKGESADSTTSADSKMSSSSSPSDENILLETKRMMEQQQQQINLLMKMMNKQGRQQLPAQTAISASMDDNNSGERHESTYLSTSSTQQKPMIVPPLKAMLFIDGTWLYYSLHTRNPKHDAIVSKFGKGWQNHYKVDWKSLPRLIINQIEKQRISKTSFSGSDRSLEIARVMVFTSAKKDTDPNSIRMRMFRDMANANYDVYMMETVGQGEKCVDIQLAVEMLHYATVPNAYDVAILLSGDKDFVPALVRTRQKGKQVCISSMRAGCNRVLYESYPHIRDYDVVWLENCLDELIVPIPEEERSRRDRAGYASSFTMMRVVRDFVASAPDHEWVSSRDIGKYLKNIEIGDSNMLEELKQTHGGLRTFLVERGCNLFEVKFPDPGAIRGRDEFSFWVRVKGESDEVLLNEFKRTQFFTKEEKVFLESYKKGKYTTGDAYDHTTTMFDYLSGDHVDMADLDSRVDSFTGHEQSAVDYSNLTVAKLREVCRERGVPVSGKKEHLISRLENHRIENDVVEKPQKDIVEASAGVRRRTTRAIGNSPKPPSGSSFTPTGSNIYASTLPQLDVTRNRNSPDPKAGAHLEALITEYLRASGGSAGSRDIGRYLAANSDSLKSNRAALSELKENFGSLLSFILSRDDIFSVRDRSGNGDDSGFPITLKKYR